MTQIYIGVNDVVSVDGRNFDVNRVLDHHTVQLVCPRNGELRNIEFDLLAKLICLGTVIVQPGLHRKATSQPNMTQCTDLLSEEDKKVLQRMIAYVQKIPPANVIRISNRSLARWISIVAEQIEDRSPPSVSTIRR